MDKNTRAQKPINPDYVQDTLDYLQDALNALEAAYDTCPSETIADSIADAIYTLKIDIGRVIADLKGLTR